jgi:hypothetical protein
MQKEIIAAGIGVGVLGVLKLAQMAWNKVGGKEDSIIGDRYIALMSAATNQVDKKIIEEIYRTERELASLGEILHYNRKHRIECEDLCLRETQVVGKFNDLEDQLSEELRIISRGF